MIWNDLDETRRETIFSTFDENIQMELMEHPPIDTDPSWINVFELIDGKLHQRNVSHPRELENRKLIWVDLIAPTTRTRDWVGEHFGLKIPDPNQLGDLEASARFYIEDNGEVHLHSDFLSHVGHEARSIAVGFILFKDILFSVRTEELPVFRLQRMRARTQPGFVTDGTDVLLDLYAADAEYSADCLEDVYSSLELVSKKVLSSQMSDEEAEEILGDIALHEDLNGRVRRNVLDTRRALSFLSRSHTLTTEQHNDSRQIVRDIESLDSHTSFLFGKINFLMDAVVGFININQNKRVNKLTVFSIIFMPINIIAGIGGMSEFSMMTADIPWQYAYSGFFLTMGAVAWATYIGLKRNQDRLSKKRTL